MKPLVVLSASFLVLVAICKIVQGNWNVTFSGNCAMCIMLCFTAFGHFKYYKGMAMMLPDFIPLKKPVIFITGFAEIILGVGMLLPQYRYVAGLMTIIFLILIVPANINAAFKQINFEQADYTGNKTDYLWFRIPMQVYLLGWIFYFSILCRL